MSNDNATRQKYRLATGQSLDKDPPKTPNSPGFKKGGKVQMPKGKGKTTPC